ncbi:MAG TPA: hypothetical protein PLG98_01950 [Smithella sp.]|nr:hypothetical protein [Smithella sp.]
MFDIIRPEFVLAYFENRMLIFFPFFQLQRIVAEASPDKTDGQHKNQKNQEQDQPGHHSAEDVRNAQPDHRPRLEYPGPNDIQKKQQQSKTVKKRYIRKKTCYQTKQRGSHAGIFGLIGCDCVGNKFHFVFVIFSETYCDFNITSRSGKPLSSSWQRLFPHRRLPQGAMIRNGHPKECCWSVLKIIHSGIPATGSPDDVRPGNDRFDFAKTAANACLDFLDGS